MTISLSGQAVRLEWHIEPCAGIGPSICQSSCGRLSGTAHQEGAIIGPVAAGSVEPLGDAAAAAAAAGRLRQLLPCSCLRVLVF